MPKKPMELLTESMLYVLMAFARGPMTGSEAAAYIQDLTGGRVKLGPATLYTLLSRFREEGYLKETETDGRRRTYAITSSGLMAYETELARLRACIFDAEKSGKEKP